MQATLDYRQNGAHAYHRVARGRPRRRRRQQVILPQSPPTWRMGDLDAPVNWHIEKAQQLAAGYGWGSMGLFQRRLRVDSRFAAYLKAELQHRGTLPPEQSPEDAEREKKASELAKRLKRERLKPLVWGRLFGEYADLRGVRHKQGDHRRRDSTAPTIGELARGLGVSESTAWRRMRLGEN